jgi:hypothetical protein
MKEIFNHRVHITAVPLRVAGLNSPDSKSGITASSAACWRA